MNITSINFVSSTLYSSIWCLLFPQISIPLFGSSWRAIIPKSQLWRGYLDSIGSEWVWFIIYTKELFSDWNLTVARTEHPSSAPSLSVSQDGRNSQHPIFVLLLLLLQPDPIHVHVPRPLTQPHTDNSIKFLRFLLSTFPSPAAISFHFWWCLIQ